jgi:4-hydroxy-4-methyl-2-oxoglutarate aldolase
MAQWKSDEELFAWIRKELSTPPVSDVMEQLGFRYPMLPAHIRPLRSDMVLIGRAMPVPDELPIEYGEPVRFDAKPWGLLFESIEALRFHGGPLRQPLPILMQNQNKGDGGL